jgi:hypothetical protein
MFPIKIHHSFSKEKCIHLYVNTKTIFVETIPGNGGWGDKGEWWRGEFKCDIFDTL